MRQADPGPKELAAEWSKGSFRPAYYLYGEDEAAQGLALAAARKLSGADELNISEYAGDADSEAGDLVSLCSTPPMFSARRLVVVRDARYGAAARKLIAEYLRSPLPSTILILASTETKLDAKDALYGAVSALGGVVQFKALTEDGAVKRLLEEAKRAGIVLEEDAAELLVEEAGSEWGILRAEFEKLKLFTAEKKRATLADARLCLGYKKETNPFDLPRALQRRDARESLTLLRGLLSDGEDPFRILYQVTATVSKQLKAKRMVKSGIPTDTIFRDLRLNKYYDRDYLQTAGRVAEPSLIKALRACLDAEVALKSKAWLDPKIELENLVLTACGK